MDRIKDSGSFDQGSIPCGFTKKIGAAKIELLPIFFSNRTHPNIFLIFVLSVEIPITSLYL